jgi:ornithine--oxo-acid transaminase
MGGRLIGNMESIKSDFPDKIKEVRGRGLLTAFEMYDEPHLDGHAVSDGLLEVGVYAKETHHSTVRLAPALTINKTQIDSLSDAIRTVVKGL